MQTILIVDDEADILDLVSLNLKKHQFQVLTADNGAEALDVAFKQKPDLIVLDIMMPEKDGYEVLTALRQDQRGAHIPVIMLTARAELDDRIKGLEHGADDYLSKPFSPKELVLRVQAMLKRAKHSVSDPNLSSGPFTLDRNNLRLTLAGKPVDLTATEFKMLRLLVEREGQPVERDALLREVWGYSDNALTRTLDSHVKRLREKLSAHAEHIQTVRSVGYCFHKVAPSA
jgi:two-component system phosphate regulon response regulator PhoB